jgi:hypothetical protein
VLAQPAGDGTGGLDGPPGGAAAPPQSWTNHGGSRTLLEGATGAGESPVGDAAVALGWVREYCGAREIPWEAGGTTLQG